jgi:hypothetical protein
LSVVLSQHICHLQSWYYRGTVTVPRVTLMALSSTVMMSLSANASITCTSVAVMVSQSYGVTE